MSRGHPLITPPRISTRLRTVSLFAVAGALLLAITTLSAVEYLNLRSTLLNDSRVEARILADNISAAVLFRDRRAATEMLQTLRASETLRAAAVALPDGSVFTALDTVQDELSGHISSAAPEFDFTVRRLYLSVPITHQGAVIGYVHTGKSLARLYQQALVYGAYALVIGAIALLLAWLAVSRTQKNVALVERDLLAMAHLDAVTRLWNRHTFNEHLAASIAASEKTGAKIAVLLLDIDNFKTVNDTLGHHGGDALLAAVAARLFNLLHEEDIVCRMGGDEFAVILQRPDADAIPLIAASITQLFAEPFTIDKHQLTVTCSVGVSIYPEHAADMPTLVRDADTAMYHAKAAGKNTSQVFTQAMRAQLERRGAIENGLRRAIEGDELRLHYQPQFDLQDMTLVGAEALLRWHSAELGQIAPAEFIPIAEESGLIAPIGDWVLRSACQQMAQWRRDGFRLPLLSINLSARQLHIPYFGSHILQIIAEAELAPNLIEIELTESVMMENLHALMEDFSLLQRSGVKLAIDDFGTGYSSMAYLKRLPLDRIKIDRTFIKDLPHGANDREIVAAMVAMAHNLGLRVTAEGVETAGQLRYLQEIRCDAVQGFYLGRPMTAAALRALRPIDTP